MSSSTPQLTHHHADTDISAGASATVSISVSTIGLSRGNYRITATLSSNLLGVDELSATAVTIEVTR